MAVAYTLEDVQGWMQAGNLTEDQAVDYLTALLVDEGGDTASARMQAQSLIDTWAGRGVTEDGAGAGDGYVPPDTPEMWESPMSVEKREDVFREQEAAPSNVFRQALQQMPMYGNLSGMGREALERQYQPALQSFLAQTTDPTSTFRNYMQGGGQVLSPQDMQAQLGEIAGYFDIPTAERTETQSFMTDPERYGSNPAAFSAYAQPLLARTNPMFRGAVGNVAQGIYDRFQGRTPEMPFMQEMARRGGFFGGR